MSIPVAVSCETEFSFSECSMLQKIATYFAKLLVHSGHDVEAPDPRGSLAWMDPWICFWNCTRRCTLLCPSKKVHVINMYVQQLCLYPRPRMTVQVHLTLLPFSVYVYILTLVLFIARPVKRMASYLLRIESLFVVLFSAWVKPYSLLETRGPAHQL